MASNTPSTALVASLRVRLLAGNRADQVILFIRYPMVMWFETGSPLRWRAELSGFAAYRQESKFRRTNNYPPFPGANLTWPAHHARPAPHRESLHCSTFRESPQPPHRSVRGGWRCRVRLRPAGLGQGRRLRSTGRPAGGSAPAPAPSSTCGTRHDFQPLADIGESGKVLAVFPGSARS